MDKLTVGFDGDFSVKERPKNHDNWDDIYLFYGIVPKRYGDAAIIDILLRRVFGSNAHEWTEDNVFGFWCTPEEFLYIQASLSTEGIEYQVISGVSRWCQEDAHGQ